MKVILQTIPNGVFITYLCFGLLGLFVFVKNNIKNNQCHALLAIIIFMVLWRVVIGISSKRYASALIPIFLGLTVYILFRLRNCKEKIFSYIFWVTFLLILIIDFYSVFKSRPYKYIHLNTADCISYFAKNKTINVCVEKKEIDRLRYYTPKSNNVNIFFLRPWEHNIYEFSSSYSSLLYISSDGQRSINPAPDSFSYECICALRSGKNKEKRFFLIHENIICEPIGFNQIHPVEDNLLQNGDFEIVDSLEESNRKNEAHLRFYKSNIYPEYITPKNVFYYSNRFNSFQRFILDSNDSIDGMYSLRIESNSRSAHSRFYQRFKSGNYNIDLYVKGSPNTSVTLYYDILVKNEWVVVPITKFVIPDKRVFHISKDFLTTKQDPNSYFQIGVYITNGQAIIDNVTIQRN